ncbi:carbohydrate kinase [Luedemannella flava]|uniref:Carbohydrate kinase n=1 Tax=Luedemannella flava TaxID=349316 RepID=A0ABP4YU76_9ACTN
MIVVCGEALIDLVPAAGNGLFLARPGGGPTNVAVGLGRLGVAVRLLARLSTDGFGQLLRAHLVGSHVDLTDAVEAGEPTTLAVVTLDASGDAVYTFYVDGCADGAWRAGDLPDALPAAAALHVSGSLALAVPAMGDAVDALLRRERPQRVITFDPNPRPTLIRDEHAARDRLDHWLASADLVKASEDDLAWMAPGTTAAGIARHWREGGAGLVVVTQGPHGAYALGADGPVQLPAHPVPVVDTVGAGDAFMAGLLTALHQAGHLTRERLCALDAADLRQCVRYALRAAALTCARAGADPPWISELGPVRQPT